MNPIFLTLEEVNLIHKDQVERYGGILGVRDEGLLISAIAQASMTFDGEYVHPTMYHMGAAYLFHIVKNHPFIDGNKRTGITCALVFFDFNDIEINAPNEDLESMVLKCATGIMNKEEIAQWFERYNNL